MRKTFLEVIEGSRGETEDSKLVYTSYGDIEENFYRAMEDFSEQEKEEWCKMEVDKGLGVVYFTLSEEHGGYYIEYSKHKELCDEIMEEYRLGNDVSDLLGRIV